MTASRCRFCDTEISESFVDLGMAPLSNAFLRPEQLNRMEPFYPLHVRVCHHCFLVQLEQFEAPEAIFGDDYAYFSSFSDTWLAHARNYVNQMIERFRLPPQTQVVELASNDGYLLQYFLERGYPVLGIEPAQNVADAARAKGIETQSVFFGTETAQRLRAEGRRADLLLGNNVLAHVPDLNDFVQGMKILLSPGGLLTMEFPHLLNLMRLTQFDTIYHEHFSYLSFLTVQQVFRKHGLRLFDVETLPTHGGSIRIYGVHDDDPRADTPRVAAMLQTERDFGLDRIETYRL